MDEPFSGLDALTAQKMREETGPDLAGDGEDDPLRHPRHRRGGLPVPTRAALD